MFKKITFSDTIELLKYFKKGGYINDSFNRGKARQRFIPMY